MSTKIKGLKSTPAIEMFNGEPYFRCQYTGILFKDGRVGIPGRSGCMAGTFCCWNAVVAFLREIYSNPALSVTLKGYIEDIQTVAFAGCKEIFQIQPLPPRDQIGTIGIDGNGLSWDDIKQNIRLWNHGGQTIADAIAKNEKRKEARKLRDTTSHKVCYAYLVGASGDPDDLSFGIMEDKPIAHLLQELKNSALKEGKSYPDTVLPGKAGTAYEDYLLFYSSAPHAATEKPGHVASQIASLFSNQELDVYGSAVICSFKKPMVNELLVDADLEDPSVLTKQEGKGKKNKKRRASEAVDTDHDTDA